ncbi:hypothetical protein Nepgr_021138 [Nepenthes gracilis]|uniref:Uncharacterized protein n=1 Tax=Nepenthes gracilis TaxID=150966 RepID=A0AAD3SYC2_NEPGR|nr:hypothetical protein Nepgr_021138 [Nepenthes gracilis]
MGPESGPNISRDALRLGGKSMSGQRVGRLALPASVFELRRASSELWAWAKGAYEEAARGETIGLRGSPRSGAARSPYC